MVYTLMQRVDVSQCVIVILTSLIKAGKDYQCSVTLFVTVSFFCYWEPVIFVCLRDLRIILITANFAGKTLVIYNLIEVKFVDHILQVQLAGHICVLVDVIYYNVLLALGFRYLRVFGYTVIYIDIAEGSFIKYYYCHVVFVMFKKF